MRFTKPIAPQDQGRRALNASRVGGEVDDSLLTSRPADELEQFVVECPTPGCEETLTLNAKTDRSLRCRHCQQEVSALVDKIVQHATDNISSLELDLPGVGALTSCRCPAPCGAFVTFPIANTIYCPVCVEQVFEPGETPEGEPVVNAYAAPNADAGLTELHQQELPVTGRLRPTSPSDAFASNDRAVLFDSNFPDDVPSEFSGFIEVFEGSSMRKPALRLPITMELQAPLLVIEPSSITAEIAGGERFRKTLSLRNNGDAPLTLRNLEAVDAQGRQLEWAKPELTSSAAGCNDYMLLEPGSAMPVAVDFHSDNGGEHVGFLRLGDFANRQTANVPMTLKVVPPNCCGSGKSTTDITLGYQACGVHNLLSRRLSRIRINPYTCAFVPEAVQICSCAPWAARRSGLRCICSTTISRTSHRGTTSHRLQTLI